MRNTARERSVEDDICVREELSDEVFSISFAGCRKDDRKEDGGCLTEILESMHWTSADHPGVHPHLASRTAI